MTIEWIRRIACPDDQRPVLLEGQTRLAYVRWGAELARIGQVRPVQADCRDEIRQARLAHLRGRPEPASKDMMAWAAFLREEARTEGCDILDTGLLDLNEVSDRLCRWLDPPEDPRGQAA